MPKERRDKSTPSRPMLLMKESGLEASVMGMEYNAGLMVQSTRANGKTIEPMAKESSSISTEISTMVIG